MNRALAMHTCALLILVNLRLFLLVAYESHSYIDLKSKKTATRLESTIDTASTIQNNDSELEMQPPRVRIT